MEKNIQILRQALRFPCFSILEIRNSVHSFDFGHYVKIRVKKHKYETECKKQSPRQNYFLRDNLVSVLMLFNLLQTQIREFNPKRKPINENCSCNTWILLRSTTRSTFRQLMIFVTMMQLKLSLHCSDKKGSIPCRVRVGEIFCDTMADVSCDSRIAVYTRRDYVSPSFSSQIYEIHTSQRIPE